MTSYLTSMDTISLSHTVFEIFDFKLVFQGFILTFDPWRSSWVKNIYTIRKPIYDFLSTSMDNISLSRTVIEIFDFKVFTVWPWPLTHKSHLKSKKFIPFESPYMTSYLTSMDTISLSRTVFEMIEFKVFRVWPWPLTPKGHLGSKKIIPFESPYMTSYRLLWTTSLYLVPFSRYSTSKFLRVWPWPLTPEGHLGSKNSYHSKAIYDFLFDNISLSRTVFEIFDFKVFRVWPWPLTPNSHLGSKNFIPLESPYMTSYLTSMDTISLSRTVFEIFEFKVFRVWPWPLTPKGHLGSKKIYHLKARL